MKRNVIRGLLVVGVFAFVLIVGELAVRFVGSRFGVNPREVNRYRDYALHGLSRFEPHPYTVFRFRRGDDVNSYGFLSPEWSTEPPKNGLRVVCLGASTTASGNRMGHEGSYPRQLELMLEKDHPELDVDVLSCGVDGWTSAEVQTAWFSTVRRFRPDVVVIHLAINDVHPRLAQDFLPDYTHWRHELRSTEVRGLERLLVRASDLYVALRLREGVPTILQLTARTSSRRSKGDPLPLATALPFVENLRAIGRSAVADGAQVVLLTMPLFPEKLEPGSTLLRLGTAQHNELMRGLVREEGWLLADAEADFGADESTARLFSDICHVKKKGNVRKAGLIRQVLRTAGR